MNDEQYLSADSDPNVRNLYKLHSVLVHSGGLNGGHYYVYVQPFGEEHAEKWYKFDDERVTCVPQTEAIEGSWGDDSADVRPHGNQYYRGGGGPKVSSAYMLVYVRESAMRELNCEVTDADIVPHLRAQLEREHVEKIQKCKERNEAHLYTVMKVATVADLAKQIGVEGQCFDLVNHELVSRFRVKKEETVADLKAMLARELGVPVHRQRLWTWVNRQNKTYRPDKPLQIEYADESPIMDVKEEPLSGQWHGDRVQAELKLFLEVVADADAPPPPPPSYPLAAGADEPMEMEAAQYPHVRLDEVLLFVKFFDSHAQTISFVGTHLARYADRLSDLAPVLREMKGLPADTALDVFEEVEFDAQVLFTRIREDRTLKEAELQHGDILVFQALDAPSDMSVDSSDALPSGTSGTLPTSSVSLFFEAVKNRVLVNICKLPQTSEAANIREREAPTKLPMDKRMAYEEVCEAVGKAVGCAGPLVRLTMHNCYTEQPKPTSIRFRGVETLFNMLMAFPNKATDTLYYEVLDIPLQEFESKKSLKVSWHNMFAEETKVLNLLLAKETTVGQALGLIAAQVELELPLTDAEGNPLPVERCVRMLELFNHRIYKILSGEDEIEQINDQYWLIRVEEIPLEERAMGPEDRVVHVRHVYQDTKHNTHTNFGDPLLVLITPADTLPSVRRRLQTRLRVSAEEVEKPLSVKLCTFGRIEELSETESVKARFRTGDNQGGNWEDYLGIEHAGPPAAARRRNAARYNDKPIKIYG